MTQEFVLLSVLSCILAVRYTAIVLFLLTVMRTIRHIHPKLRQISPSEVWWCLVPLIGLGFAIRIAWCLVPAIHRQFQEHGESTRNEWFEINTGWVWAISRSLIIFFAVFFKFVFVEILPDHNSLQIWIFILLWLLLINRSFMMYWTQIKNYERRLREFSSPDYSEEELDYNNELEE